MAFLISKSKAFDKGVFDSNKPFTASTFVESLFYFRGIKIKERRKIHEGYIFIFIPEHPYSDNSGYVKEARLIAEKAIGHILPRNIIVHHLNGNKSDNTHSNLVICENQAYHLLLHRRKEALDQSGYAYYKKCVFCKKYDDPKNLILLKRGNGNIAVYHI